MASNRFEIDLGEWFRTNAPKVESDLRAYFAGGDTPYTGRWFERMAALSDPDAFGASDLIAVEALSVQVPPEAAAVLLLEDQDRFNSLLAEIPGDVDLWEAPESLVGPGTRQIYCTRSFGRSTASSGSPQAS